MTGCASSECSVDPPVAHPAQLKRRSHLARITQQSVSLQFVLEVIIAGCSSSSGWYATLALVKFSNDWLHYIL